MDIFKKLALKSKLQAEINKLEQKISNINCLISDLENNNILLSNTCTGWDTQYTTYNSATLTPDIYRTDEFEGEIAEYFCETVPNCIEKIQSNCSEMRQIKSGIGEQIGLLQKNITVLNIKISKLREEIAALGV